MPVGGCFGALMISFLQVQKNAKSTENTQPTNQIIRDEKAEEAFRPESDDDSETENIGDKTEHTEEKDGDENKKSNDSVLMKNLMKPTNYFFEVLQIPKDAPETFNEIKTVYRKELPNIIQIRYQQWVQRSREVAEQKAKEINEAYEHFRKNISLIKGQILF